jgi:hypothetical protein
MALVFYNDDNYYTIPANQSKQTISKVYIIPEKNLEYAVIEK